MAHPLATSADVKEALEYEARIKEVAGKAKAIARKAEAIIYAVQVGMGAILVWALFRYNQSNF